MLMTRQALASSTFDVGIALQAHNAEVGDARSGRMALGEIFSGDLDPICKGQMLTVRTDAEGAAGDVAMGYVTGACTAWSEALR